MQIRETQGIMLDNQRLVAAETQGKNKFPYKTVNCHIKSSYYTWRSYL